MWLRLVGLLVVIGWTSACAPEIGDDCEGSVDCSVSGDRICDRSVPNSGGYCTIKGCEEGTCPDGALCVQFRLNPPRLMQSWCMASCENNGDCRPENGFQCITVADFGDDEDFARVLEGNERKFCAAVPAM